MDWDGARPLVVHEPVRSAEGGGVYGSDWSSDYNNRSSGGSSGTGGGAQGAAAGGGGSGLDLPGSTLRQLFRDFFRTFHIGNNYVYRDALLHHYNKGEYFIEVDMGHVTQFSDALFASLESRPNEALPLFEGAAKEALKLLLGSTTVSVIEKNAIPDFQVILRGSQAASSLRQLTSQQVNKLVKVPGIVISCSRARARATLVTIRCSKCGNVQRLPCKSAFGGVNLPLKCTANQMNLADPCPANPFVIMADMCEYIDQQTLKMQESPEVVPTGEMPRSVLLSVDRYLVDRVSPGTRVAVLAISSLYSTNNGSGSAAGARMGGASVRAPYLRVVGIVVEAEGGGRTGSTLSSAEEEQMLALSRDPNIYDRVARSIAPQISGSYTVDIKKALACLLMGGSRKSLPDGVRLRGDINVLLMGDPSTAKSQFLKFIERIAPVGVYTSGKGSSAAGLTASVIKDSKGEFFLEGGAMVLADGGVICIDEFDKMRETDRVAIHEAMEQQTISIAKAGITTVLNSRVSVLAAANPIFGRYDDLKSIGDNIDLMSTILSRFDCIFIVRDVRDPSRDRDIARHVLGVHISAAVAEGGSSGASSNMSGGGNGGGGSGADGEIDVSTLKKFVAFCRDRCAPRLSEEAASILSSQYVHIRNEVRLSQASNPGEATVVPITVRQLEALIRISESLAKMRLSAEAGIADVEEALRLFKVSTLAASQSNPALLGNTASSEDVKRVEEFLRRRMGLRMTVNAKKIIEEALVLGHGDDVVKRAIAAMVVRGEIMELNQHKLLRRLR